LAEKAQELPQAALVIEQMREEVDSKTLCNSKREGLFRAVLKASFVRTFDYVEYLYCRVKGKDTADAFFTCGALRQCCEDLIALKYLARLPRKQRDEIVESLMVIQTAAAISKQNVFFRRKHPHQPILGQFFLPSEVDQAKNNLTNIGAQTGLWEIEKRLCSC
jgi:hypothetical protein